jgi:hypothetical protein
VQQVAKQDKIRSARARLEVQEKTGKQNHQGKDRATAKTRQQPRRDKQQGEKGQRDIDPQ